MFTVHSKWNSANKASQIGPNSLSIFFKRSNKVAINFVSLLQALTLNTYIRKI